MTAWLIAAVGVVYAYVGARCFLAGDWQMGIVWSGYAFSQVGLYFVTAKGLIAQGA